MALCFTAEKSYWLYWNYLAERRKTPPAEITVSLYHEKAQSRIRFLAMQVVRDFHKKPPASREEAVAWAEADFEAIQRLYQVNSAALKNARIAIFTPARPMESNDLGTLRYYWEELFHRAGAGEVVWKPLKQMAQPVF